MATSRRVGNYSTSAKAVIRASDQIFDAAMSGKPDFTKISQEAIKGRSMERRAVTKAEADVASAGLEAFTKTKYAKTRAETAEKVESIKKPARRMAGVVGALGTLSGAYVLGQTSKKDKAAHDEWMKKFDERTAAIDARLSQPNPTPEMIPDAPTLERPTLSTDQPSSGTSDSSGSGSSLQDVSAGGSFDPSKVMTKAQIKALAESVGFNPEASGIVVGIAGGESGFDPTNSTRRSGLYAKTGEDSVGLMQINWGYHKDSGWLQKLGITKREDLYDPVKNMTAAKYLYDGRKGGFGDWTVYNKGIYKRYL